MPCGGCSVSHKGLVAIVTVLSFFPISIRAYEHEKNKTNVSGNEDEAGKR